MNTFYVDSIKTDARYRASTHGILRAEEKATISHANMVAKDIVSEARAQAERMLEQAKADAEEKARHAEADVLQRAAVLLQKIEQKHNSMLDGAQELVIDLVNRLFDHLVMTSTPRERIEAGLRRLMREAPSRSIEAALHVHPDDVALLPDLKWDVKPDPTIAPGSCRLEAVSGEWQADFHAAAQAVADAFTRKSTDGTVNL